MAGGSLADDGLSLDDEVRLTRSARVRVAGDSRELARSAVMRAQPGAALRAAWSHVDQFLGEVWVKRRG